MSDEKTHPIDPNILVESLVSARTGKPVVHIRWGPMDGQLTPEEARRHAQALMEVAFAAELDAFVVKWVTTAIGADTQKALMVLRDFRAWRQEQDPK